MENVNYIDLSRAVISVNGADAHKFLQGIISNDIGLAAEEKAVYAYLLTPQGKYLFDFFITRKGDDFLIEIAAGDKDEFLKKLKMYKLRSQVEIHDLSTYAAYAVMGNQTLGYADPRSDNMFRRIILPKDTVKAEELASISYYHKLRMDNNIPEGIYDLEKDRSYPLHYRMIELNGVDFKKGCYVGQEVTARTHHRGVIRKKVYKITSPFELGNHKGTDIQSNEAKVGTVLSSSGKQALALIDVEVAQNPQAELNILEYPISVSQ